MAQRICSCKQGIPQRGRHTRGECDACHNARRPKQPCTNCGNPTAQALGHPGKTGRCRQCRSNKRCTYTNCENQHKARGMCGQHYNAWLLQQPAEIHSQYCATDGCARRIIGQGLCHKHYSALWRDQNPERWREIRSEQRQRRRAREHNAYVKPVDRKQVFALDGYVCHLCGKGCDKTKTVPHHQAPTVDHVIPLAAGGTHEPANCRTAHFICNARKSNGGGGEQFALDLA